MDDNSLLQYENSLKELEKQKETLELVMKRMGAEWEESGAGIGWMGDLPLTFDNSKQQQQKHQDNIPPPLLDMIHSVQHSNHGPSHDYLQTLLHVNEELLAESLASNKSCQDETPSTLMRLAPPQQTNQLLITPPLTTIDEINNTTANTSTITNSIAQQQQVINQLSTPPITPRNE